MKLVQIKNHLTVFQMCYVKAKGTVQGLVISSLLAVFFNLFYSIYAGKIIDSSLLLASNGGSLFTLFVPLGVFVSLLFFSTVAYHFKSYYELLYNNNLELISDDYKNHKNLSLDPQTYINPEFTAKKTILEWNGWKVTGSSKTIIELVVAFVPAILYIVVLANYNLAIGLLTLLSTVPTIIASTKFGKRVWAIWDDNSENKVIWSMYRNAFWGDITDLRLMGAGKYLINKMLGLHRSFLEKITINERNRLINVIATSLVEYLFLIGAYLILFSGIINRSFTVGDFFVITAALWGAKTEMGKFFENLSVLESNASFIDSFVDYINWKPVISNIKNSKIIPKNQNLKIEFRDVWFKYPRTDKWIFKGLNFTLTPDEDIAIVGKNGAGKTTLVRLLTRIYDPTRGQILINNIPLVDINLDEFHKSVGMLNQSFKIYGFTAKENIHIGDVSRKLRQDEIKTYSILAKADKIITDLKQGYNTYLTNEVQDGQELSGGQLQRVAIARVFYREPKLLILDEPTSAIDAIAEEEIFNNIFKYSKNKTVIIISHRFSTVKKAKRIMVIDKGQIVEDGSHATLMSHSGLYKKMHDSQSLD